MEISGIPLHPLIVHAAVVFAPLAALNALVYALVPRWRWLLRWPLVVVTLLAVGSAVLAATSGEALLESREGLESLPAVEDHEEAGELLRNVMLGFGVVALLSAWRLGGPSPLSSRPGRDSSGALGAVISAVLVLAAVAVLVAAVLAGHTGAKAVWGS